MRIEPLLTLVSAVAITMSAPAWADNCVNTAINNPAFSSDYVTNARPCPPPPAPARTPAPSDKSLQSNGVRPSKALKTTTASVKPVDPDHATVTNTPNGTLLKSGDTTVCVSGSVSAVMATSAGRLRGSLKEHEPSESACN